MIYRRRGRGGKASSQPLTIVSLEDDNVIKYRTSSSPTEKTIKVSVDNGATWEEKTATSSGVTLATLNTGDKLLIVGNKLNHGESNNTSYCRFTSTGRFNIEGNIMSLLTPNGYDNITTITDSYVFNGLFNGCSSLVSAKNLILPATILTGVGCYYQMFYNCESLIEAPALPATILSKECYSYMFYHTGLTVPPDLPALELAESCYAYMFYYSQQLLTAPQLPATTLAKECYSYMFMYCNHLVQAPTLPATTLAQSCYKYMFSSCSALTTAPELPATELAWNCYERMFNSCTSLTTAPELPATTVTSDCYNGMFSKCSALTTAPVLPATTLATACYTSMFSYCSSLNYIKCLATNISAANCLSSWVTSVKATGTFVKDSSMADWTTGISGIPSGWQVETV